MGRERLGEINSSPSFWLHKLKGWSLKRASAPMWNMTSPEKWRQTQQEPTGNKYKLNACAPTRREQPRQDCPGVLPRDGGSCGFTTAASSACIWPDTGLIWRFMTSTMRQSLCLGGMCGTCVSWGWGCTNLSSVFELGFSHVIRKRLTICGHRRRPRWDLDSGSLA